MKVLHVNADLAQSNNSPYLVDLLTEAKNEKDDFELLTLTENEVAKKAIQAGIRTKILRARNQYNIVALKRLITYINKSNFDIVHTHGMRANLYLALIHRYVKAKWVTTVHSNPLTKFSNRKVLGKLLTKVNSTALKRADGMFAITQNLSKLLVNQLEIPKTNICVIYNGIFFHDNATLLTKYKHPYFNVINIASLEKNKGQDLLLKAIKKTNNPNIHLHIVGEGKEQANLCALVKKLKLDQQVTFHGSLSRWQLTKLYQRMDLAALTSYSENFPFFLLEASDNLVPILSTNVAEIKKMIPDDNHGFVTEVGNQQQLKEKLVYASNLDKKILQQIATTEKAYLANTFSMANQLAAIKNYYRILLGVN